MEKIQFGEFVNTPEDLERLLRSEPGYEFRNHGTSPENVKPLNLASAAATIWSYAKRHNLPPDDMMKIFEIGSFSFQIAGAFSGVECGASEKVDKTIEDVAERIFRFITAQGLTGSMVIDIYIAGLFAYETAGKLPFERDAMVIYKIRDDEAFDPSKLQ